MRGESYRRSLADTDIGLWFGRISRDGSAEDAQTYDGTFSAHAYTGSRSTATKQVGVSHVVRCTNKFEIYRRADTER